jgi:CxxC motif-containing protein (DUF1111 family)
MKRLVLTLLVSIPLLAQAPPPPVPGFGVPLPNLTPAQRAAFNAGRREFTDIETVADGLGPVFNGRSCVECHNAAAPGGAGRRLVTRIGRVTRRGFDPLTEFGGSLLEVQAIGPADGSPHQFQPEVVPRIATIVAHRRTTALFGLGAVDNTPDSVFIALAAQEAQRRDGTAGRVAMVDNLTAGMKTVGKFGWKAQVPTLLQFAGDAYLNEMGITNPLFPNENCPRGDCSELAFNPMPAINDTGDGIRELADFMSLLAPPPRDTTQNVSDGEAVFSRIGCDSCHTATLRTADNREYHPYSDFLLHDMGPLGDGIPQGAATATEIRTAPLWGLRVEPSFLHDGRAATIQDAILAHDGQGRAARDRFARLDASSQSRLLAFLRSL